MRALVCIFCIVLTGCTSRILQHPIFVSQCETVGASLGMPAHEVAAIAQESARKNRLVVFRVQKASDDSIEVYLADRQAIPIFVAVFRKFGDGWEEEIASRRAWSL
jgi:hypothetical protein